MSNANSLEKTKGQRQLQFDKNRPPPVMRTPITNPIYRDPNVTDLSRTINQNANMSQLPSVSGVGNLPNDTPVVQNQNIMPEDNDLIDIGETAGGEPVVAEATSVQNKLPTDMTVSIDNAVIKAQEYYGQVLRAEMGRWIQTTMQEGFKKIMDEVDVRLKPQQQECAAAIEVGNPFGNNESSRNSSSSREKVPIPNNYTNTRGDAMCFNNYRQQNSHATGRVNINAFQEPTGSNVMNGLGGQLEDCNPRFSDMLANGPTFTTYEPNFNVEPVEGKVRIDKWDVVFDGTRNSITIEDFVFRVEYLKTHYGIPWAEVLRDFHRLLRGQAKEWYWLFLKTFNLKVSYEINKNNINPNINTNEGKLDWPTLRFSLLKQYQSNRSDFEIMCEFVNRKQQAHETIDEYFQIMLTLRSRLRTPIPDYEMIKIFKTNLRENLARMIYPMAIYSIEQLREECKEIERRFPKRDLRSIPPPQNIRYAARKHLDEIYDENLNREADEDPDVLTVDEITQRRKIELKCWNCKLPGHTYMECDSSVVNRFCYKCGMENTVTPKCPKCNPENSRRSLTKAGESRSTQTSAIQEP